MFEAHYLEKAGDTDSVAMQHLLEMTRGAPHGHVTVTQIYLDANVWKTVEDTGSVPLGYR